MSETRYTPGPWTLETVPTSCGVCHKVGPFPGKREGDKPRHACLYANYPSTWNPADNELFANARLIAAAPDLLEALQAVVAISDRKHEAWDMAHAAIAKALGLEGEKE